MNLSILGIAIIIIQYYICKKSKGKSGLVLPTLSFIVSIVYTFNVGAVDSTVYKTMFEVFLLMNLPTVILYLMYKNIGK